MFLDIHELELNKIDFQESLAPGKIDLGEFIRQVAPLEVKGTAELIETEIHLRGHLRTEVEFACDRCLESSRRRAETGFDLYYRPMSTIARSEEIEIAKDELDIGFYEGDGLELNEVIKEQVLLALPMKNLCQPDCAGLCPVCGKNRNQVACECELPPKDIRWAALQNFKK